MFLSAKNFKICPLLLRFHGIEIFALVDATMWKVITVDYKMK